jgi:hypothetical protein
MKSKMSRPYIGVVCTTAVNTDGTFNCDEIVYEQPRPFLAASCQVAKKILVAQALRGNVDLDPARLEVFVLPFGMHEN